MQNLYAPPQAEVESAKLPSPPKPKAVSLLQAIGYLTFSVAALGAVFGFLQSFDPQRQPASLSATLLMVGIRIAIALALATLLTLVHRRSQVSRLLGTVFIALLGVPAIALFFMQREGATAVYLLGWNGFAIALFAAFFYWGYSFGFSKKARTYFAFHTGS